MKNNRLKSLISFILSGCQYQGARHGRNYFDQIWIDNDFLLIKYGSDLRLRNFADIAYKNFSARILIANTSLKIANLYQLKDLGGVLAIRNLAGDEYANMDIGQILCKGAGAIDHQVDAIHLGEDTTHGVTFPSFTSAQRDTLNTQEGMTIWNSDNTDLETVIGGVWKKIVTGAVDS